MDVLNKQATRVLKLLGNKSSEKVISTLGAEQEYFLIDRAYYEKRRDLFLTGRTLFGAGSPRGQEMDDHYFGTLHERVASFMNDVNNELWKLGVSAKTQHNEVAPGQYELAPLFATVNVATDHNQLIMETLQKIAARHDLVCLLHEKPFAGVNGSGKHNNWSMVTDDGINLLDPGDTPHDNMVFLVMLCSVIKAVDKYANLLRASVANTGNEHRLGANEAPPAIVSIFLGEQLEDIFEQLAKGNAKSSKNGGELKLGISTLPSLPKDCTDRNRTSPFAFTGNKFEFRMVGSTQSTAGPNFVLNTIVAEVLSEIGDELEKADDVKVAAQKILSRIATEHKNVIFNGDNYTEEWVKEAEKRNLPNIPTTVGALKRITDPENVEVFEKHKVLSKEELQARMEVLLEAYSMQINIEAETMLNIAKTQILPAAAEYTQRLGNAACSVKNAGIDNSIQADMLEKVCKLMKSVNTGIDKLEKAVSDSKEIDDVTKQAESYRAKVIPAMMELRKPADELETIVDADIWPLPSYAEMLFLR
jgi:glutamine synthetase